MGQKRKFSSLGGDVVRTPDHSGHVAKEARSGAKKAHRRKSGSNGTPRHFPTAMSADKPSQTQVTPSAKVTAQTPAKAASSVKQPTSILSAADPPEPPAEMDKKARNKWRRKMRQSLASVQNSNASQAAESPDPKPQVQKQTARPVDALAPSAAHVDAITQTPSVKSTQHPQHSVFWQRTVEQRVNNRLRQASTTQLVPTPRKQWNPPPGLARGVDTVKEIRAVDRACQTDIHGRLHLNIMFEKPHLHKPQLHQRQAAYITKSPQKQKSEPSLTAAQEDISMSIAHSEASHTGEQKQVGSPLWPREVKGTDMVADEHVDGVDDLVSDSADDMPENEAPSTKILEVEAATDGTSSAAVTGKDDEAREHEIIEISSGSESSSEYISSDDENEAANKQAMRSRPKTPSPTIKPQAPSSSAKFTSRSLLDHPPFSLIPGFHQTGQNDALPSTSFSKISQPMPIKKVAQPVKLRDDSPSSSAHSSLFAGIKGEATVARLGTQGFGPIAKAASAQTSEAARKAASNNDARSAFDRFSSFVGGDKTSDESDSDSDSDEETDAKQSGASRAEKSAAMVGLEQRGRSSPARTTPSRHAQAPLKGSIRETNDFRASQQLEQEAQAVSQETASVESAHNAKNSEDEEVDSANSGTEENDQGRETDSGESESEDEVETSPPLLDVQASQTEDKIQHNRIVLQQSAPLVDGHQSDNEASQYDSAEEIDDGLASEEAGAQLNGGHSTKSTAPVASSTSAAAARAISLSSRVEVPASQDDDDATALLDGYSEDQQDPTDVSANPSRTPTTSAATTSAQEQPDSGTSISVFSEHLNSTTKDSNSFLGQRLGGTGSRQAANSELTDAATPSRQLTFTASEDEDDIYDTIDEVTEGVFNATRHLPSLDILNKSEFAVSSTARRRLAKDVYIPRVPKEIIACYSAQVFDVSTQDASQTDVVHDSLPLPHLTNEDLSKPYMPHAESSSSLTDLGSTPTPPGSPIVRDFAHDPILVANHETLPPLPKKRRKTTGSTSKHFSPDKRTKRERDREDENNQVCSDMLADDTHGSTKGELPTGTQTTGPTLTPVKSKPKAKRKTTGKKSDHFLPTHLLDRVDLPSPSKGQGKTPAGVSRAPIPPITSTRFGIIQEKLWDEPFWLLIATIFLNQTTGRQAVPVFWAVKARYDSPEGLAKAEFPELLEMIGKLGLQNQRVKRLIKIAEIWVVQPPVAGTRYRTIKYPEPTDHVQYNRRKVKAIEGDAVECKGALEIGYLPGLGPYAWDSWRIFCRDALRGVAEDYNGKGAADGFHPEWQRVVPLDKELRATLRWMWLREGYIWDHFTGERRKATEEEMERAVKGEMDVADEKEKVFAAQAAGVVEMEDATEEGCAEDSVGYM
ncbi:hypothetical protein LTR78_002436 [Recurvomyces mirabilis]|uniref:HhH-GPD domain-containing protein n=1 Tax=Recurvomyces mirabilis TaxID=574656 RepID=A0AAE0WT19_9PEZI|nr:hypothetical protein LTR78_002436 [Recurvomyces mirabilis]KAK5157365.1 hypothetical protein LTS14_004130 [Recurvomyces mirabilis]